MGGQALTRTQVLRNNTVSKGYVVKKEDGSFAKLGFRPDVKICLERGRLWTESYKETEGEALELRQAKALAKVLESMTINIRDSELLVGCFSSDPAAFPIYPEMNRRMLEEGFTAVGDMLDEEGRLELKEICQYWNGKAIDDRVRAILPDDLKDYVDFNGIDEAQRFSQGIGLPVPNHEKLLRIGLNGVVAEIDQRLTQLKSNMFGLQADDYIDQVNSLEAMKIACKGAIRFGERFAEKARDMAKGESDPARKKDLEKIADVCTHVPANPARTLHEALQSWFFSHLINRLIEWHGQACGDRFDVLFHPFYEQDKAEGRITREGAQELLECLWFKIEEMGKLETREGHGAAPGSALMQNFVIGGVDAQGEDASNEFSFIVIDSAMSIRSPQSLLILRYHSRINPELVSKAIDCIRSGLGYPAILNDSSIIPYIMDRGIPLEEARTYSIPGCVAWNIPNKCMRVNIPNVGLVNLGKCFELALHEGKDPITGKQWGCVTPHPKTFTSIDDIMEAYLKQVGFVADKVARIGDIGESMYARCLPRPFVSSLLDGCIEKGKDATSWRYHAFPSIVITGSIDVADSLAAIKKFVFEDQVLTMEELLGVLKDNFEGNEELRQRLINEVPKFGNDDDYVDLLARDVHHRTQKEIEKLSSYWGYPYSAEGSIAGAYFPWGRRVGALPNGKKYRETFADGSISPYPGRDKNGPSAVLKSVGKITPKFPELFNQRFMPQFLEGENKKAFADYIRTSSDLGIYHVQFNCVDDKTLLDAQAQPDKHSDLVVRVAGYSAYFVDLSKGVQDEIVARVGLGF